ncbi:fluoride efflux transporter CrcB [Marinivivus vitaminiproducens]|uniref:fluoride efflux transporter CrcB n=1 Tax=Marinivivus vitaminiproducens TaxID=3035935 RepID=UPI0027A4171D|nr:fluoride efflux transporter CrcB [Geminicoccaceae bacterium SCSIO 64248]
MARELYLAFLVFIGAGLGGALRHGVNRAVPLVTGLNFPLATLLVNATGCFVMGILAGLFAFRGGTAGQELRLLLTTGVLGGFTTFSAFSLDAALLWERGALGLAALYVGGTVALTLLGVFAGLAVIRAALG